MGIRFEIMQRRTLANQEPPGTLVAFKSDQIALPEASSKLQPKAETGPPVYAFIGPTLSTEDMRGHIFPRQAIIDTLRRDDSIYLSLNFFNFLLIEYRLSSNFFQTPLIGDVPAGNHLKYINLSTKPLSSLPSVAYTLYAPLINLA